VYSLQIVPPEGTDLDDPHLHHRWGFRGSPFLGLPWDASGKPPEQGNFLDYAHIATTYVALCALRILGDDYSRLNKRALLAALRQLQSKDGSFSPVACGSESDMRFIYCAAAISYMIQDWSGFNIDAAVQYVLSSQAYDYALSQGPGQESHGGSTYCGLATLVLTGYLDLLPHKDKLVQWLVERQVSGFQGRINKDPDTCYSFWIGSSLIMLDALHLANHPLSKSFTTSCKTKYGGFSKCPDAHPDILHTYFSLCGLSMMGKPGLNLLDCSLGMTKRAKDGFTCGLTARQWRESRGI